MVGVLTKPLHPLPREQRIEVTIALLNHGDFRCFRLGHADHHPSMCIHKATNCVQYFLYCMLASSLLCPMSGDMQGKRTVKSQ